MSPELLTENLEVRKLLNPKLHSALQMYMYMLGTNGKFAFSEDLEEKINQMRLHFNHETGCYTDFTAIYIGLLFQYFTDDLNENFNIVKGIIGHEVGHLRFTSKKAWDSFCNTAVGKYKKLAALARDFLNIVEDDRIEYWMAIVSKFLKDAFYLLCQRMAVNIQLEFDKIEEDQELSPSHKLNIMRNATLYIRCTQMLPKIKNKELMGYLKEIYPYMIYCRTSKSTKRAVQVTHKIMEILSPLRDEFEENNEERMKGMFDDDSKGSNSPMEDGDMDKLDNSSKKSSKKKKKKNEDDENDFPEEVEKLKKKMAKKVAKELGDDEEEKTGNEGGSRKEDEDDSEGDKDKDKSGKEDKDSDEKALDDENDSDGDEEDDSSEQDGSSNNNNSKDKNNKNQDNKKDSSDSEDSEYAPATGEEDDNKSLRDYVDDITSNLEKYAGDINQKVKERTATLRQEARKPVTKEILGDYLKSTKKTEKQKIKESLEEKKIADLKPVLVNPDIHNQCKPVFREKHHLEPFTDEEYVIYVEENIDVIKTGAKELQKLSEQKRQSKLRMQRRGKLDNRSLIKAAAFNAEDVYYKKNIDKNKIDMDVLIFIDRSGSNNSLVQNFLNDISMYRYEVNRTAAIIQHEMLKRAKITHAVWSFEEQGWNNVFSPMIDFSNCFEPDAGLYLKDIGASGANRDGYSISYAGEYLLKHGKNHKKLLIVISDGQPSGIAGYGGNMAMNDVKNTIKDLSKKGVKTIGIFTGSPEENQFFEKMYDNHLFFNNDSISKLPEDLRKKIAAEFRDYLKTF